MSAKLEDMITQLIGREGRYSNNPNDTGGETMWGITVATARRNGYNGPMAAMPRSVAAAIYRAEYWVEPNFDAICMVDQAIAEELLDTGVNMGPTVASKFLQRCLNVLNQRGKLYPDLVVDGQLGKKTIEALSAFLMSRGNDGRIVLLRMLNALQSVRYIELAEANPSQEEFEFGWQLNRVGAL